MKLRKKREKGNRNSKNIERSVKFKKLKIKESIIQTNFLKRIWLFISGKTCGKEGKHYSVQTGTKTTGKNPDEQQGECPRKPDIVITIVLQLFCIILFIHFLREYTIQYYTKSEFWVFLIVSQ